MTQTIRDSSNPDRKNMASNPFPPDFQPKKIVVRVCNWIGDVVMNLPALEVLRAHYPNAEIAAVARPWVRSLLDLRRDLVDRCIDFDDRGKHRGTLGFLRFCRSLRDEGFEAAFVFTNHLKGALMMRLAGVPIRVGFANGETRWFLNRRLSRKAIPKARHQFHRYLDLLAAVGIESDKRRPPKLMPDQAQIEAAEAKFLSNLRRPLLSVHAGAAYGTAKRWLPDRYGEVCRRFLEEQGGTVVLLGVIPEKDTNDTIAVAAAHERLLNLCGKTGLGESIAIIAASDGFLSNDSGLMHVAAALGIPQVAVFGPTDVNATYPANPRARMLFHPVPCSPCFKRHCPIGHDCMVGMGTDRVWKAVGQLFSS